MKDYGVATIVGTKTFGKGIVQTLMPLSDGSAIKLTTDHYYTPNGNDIHGKGIEPDVEVELDEEAAQEVVIPEEKDNQLQKAVEVLPGDTPQTLQRRVMEQAEWKILPRAVSLFCEDKIIVKDNKTEILD